MSPIQTILAHVDAGPRNATRLRVARELAQQQGARLHALYAATPAYMDLPFEVAGGAAAVDLLKEIDDSRLATARTALQQVQQEPGVEVAWAEASDYSPMAAFTQQALYADLLVLGQYDPDLRSSAVPPDFVESVLIACGRPALVLPYVGVAGPVGSTVLVAWKESPQAAHALAAALPLLRAARQVHVAQWGPAPVPVARPALDVEQYLRGHGVAARVQRYPDEPATVGELLLSLAADLSADLLVMGCYGHTRARELVLGGTTRTILKSMTLPVLLAH